MLLVDWEQREKNAQNSEKPTSIELARSSYEASLTAELVAFDVIKCLSSHWSTGDNGDENCNGKTSKRSFKNLIPE